MFQISEIVVDGKVESRIIHLREGVRISRTVMSSVETLGRVAVYVGDDGLAVALQFVDPLP